MALPEIKRLELPILQELKATGGSEHLRYLYDRLIGYFPQIAPQELEERAKNGRNPWRARVQRAGKSLEECGELRRANSLWKLTAKGLRRVESEAMLLETARRQPASDRKILTHQQAQAILVEIGQIFGRHAEAEFEHYDVVWRESANAPRLSHVFEVQISGSVDSALTRLKHAYDSQRSKIYLVIADERDRSFARKRLTGSFHEIWDIVSVIGVGELQRMYEAIKAQETLLAKLLTR